jgi:hypothetical protein
MVNPGVAGISKEIAGNERNGLLPVNGQNAFAFQHGAKARLAEF